MPKPVIPRARAHRDVDEAIDYYLKEHAGPAALGFIDALQAAFLQIARSPKTGSPRYAQELNIFGLRYLVLKRYPYLVFYVEFESHIDVWRVLHAQRDIPAWMQAEEEP